MTTPSIAILGVYQPDITTRVYKQQWKVTGSDEQTKAHFKDLVLIEAVVEQIDGRFKMTELGQPYTRGGYKDHLACSYFCGDSGEADRHSDQETHLLWGLRSRFIDCVVQFHVSLVVEV